jgi:hypothetical protein
MYPKKVLIVALLALAGALLNLSCSSQRPGADTRAYRMGEPVAVGALVYNISDTEWLDQLGSGPSARIPQNRFLLIRLTVTNGGASNSAIPEMTLVDPRGQTYHELTEGQEVDEWLGYLRTVSPAQTERGRVLFDVPTGAYRLRVTNDAEPGSERAALIELPLQITPVLPTPPAGR